MARFRADEANNYGGQGGGGFFSINEDKGVKRVRFMYNSIEDVEGCSVHEVEVNGKKRYVNCIREYNDPIDVCPFCRDHKKTLAKLLIPLYNIDEDQVQIWDRGKKMFEKMSSVCSRYASHENLVQHVFEIERHGKPRDMQTSYEIFEVEKDNTSLEDLPECPKIIGGLILDKTAEDMEYYLQENEFPPADDEDEQPVRRRETSRSDDSVQRRTPTTRRREESF